MHDINFLCENLDYAKNNLGKRKFDTAIIDELVALNGQRKKSITLVEEKRAQLNKISKEVGMLKKAGKNDEAQKIIEELGKLKAEIPQLETELEAAQAKIDEYLVVIPNFISEQVPVGNDEESNQEIFRTGEIPHFDFQVRDHVDLGESLGMLSFDQGAKLSGSRFVVYKKDLARMERALINFMLDQHMQNGYEEILPPYIVHERSLMGTGQLPKFKEDLFKIEGQDWYLIPTAEVPLTNLHREEILDDLSKPLRFVAYTPCFRSEAGSYGKDTRGLIRLHQFNKVELVNIVSADYSERAHEEMINRARSILEQLKLPYRGMLLCSGDIGFGARKCVDLEVWLPSQNRYREISSISNCGDFQSRRASIRYRGENGKPQYAHTLNGSGLAVGRTLVAILENYQQADGTVAIPEVLIPYMGGQERISL